MPTHPTLDPALTGCRATRRPRGDLPLRALPLALPNRASCPSRAREPGVARRWDRAPIMCARFFGVPTVPTVGLLFKVDYGARRVARPGSYGSTCVAVLAATTGRPVARRGSWRAPPTTGPRDRCEGYDAALARRPTRRFPCVGQAPRYDASAASCTVSIRCVSRDSNVGAGSARARDNATGGVSGALPLVGAEAGQAWEGRAILTPNVLFGRRSCRPTKVRASFAP